MEELARSYITHARQISASGCYSKSFDLYVAAFEKCPGVKFLYEPEFRIVLIRLNEILAAAGKIENIFSNFERAIEAFPENFQFLNEIGKYLYKYGYYSDAWNHFQKALKLNIEFVDAERNLNSIKNLLVERWHYRMLNDKIRNEAYRRAIHQLVIPYQDNVLDIGTGTGILTVYANECYPKSKFACDGSETMTKIAECVMQENGIADVTVINKMSTELNCIDIFGKKSVLVTELFDAGLFGEHILQTLTHAWENLLLNTAQVVPSKAEFFVAGVKCDALNSKYQLSRSVKENLNITSMNVHIMTFEQTYDCEDVHLMKEIQYITDSQSVIKVDFRNYLDLKKKLERSEPYSVKIKAIESGEINIIVGWFNLYLTDKIMITTDPRCLSRANAWQQAVFFDFIPIEIKGNNTICVNFSLKNGKLTLLPTSDTHITRISPETLRFLNDMDYVNMIKHSIPVTCVYLGQIVEISQVKILDLCPFPLFGLLMLKRGVKSVVCNPKTKSDEMFIKKVLEANDIPLSKVDFILGDEWSHEIFGDEKFHAIFYHIFELCGDINIHRKKIIQYTKHANLLPGGLFIPAKIKLIAQIVNCEWFDINNRLYNVNVQNYKIEQFLNAYQVSQTFCIDYEHLNYIPLTHPHSIGYYYNSSNMRSEVINIPIIRNGDANAVLCWYNIELLEDIGEISTCRKNCFMDGMAFLANPKLSLIKGYYANILKCVDVDGSFKLMIDKEE